MQGLSSGFCVSYSDGDVELEEFLVPRVTLVLVSTLALAKSRWADGWLSPILNWFPPRDLTVMPHHSVESRWDPE